MLVWKNKTKQTSVNHCIVHINQYNRTKETKGVMIGSGGIKVSLFTDDMIVCRKLKRVYGTIRINTKLNGVRDEDSVYKHCFL